MEVKTFKRLQVLRALCDLFDTEGKTLIPRNAKLRVVNPNVLPDQTIKVRTEDGAHHFVHIDNIYESALGRPSKMISKAYNNTEPLSLDIDV